MAVILPELLLPGGLPDFKADSHSLTPSPMYGDVPRQVGASRKRRLFRSVPRMLEAQLELTQTQLEQFYAWHEGPLRAGAEAFAAKVAKRGPGVEYWVAHVLEWSSSHQEGSTHILNISLKLEHGPFPAPPVSATMKAEAYFRLLTLGDTSPSALQADANLGLEFGVDTGALWQAEFFLRLQTEFNGPSTTHTMLTAESTYAFESFFVVEPPVELAGEANFALEFSALDSNEISASATLGLVFTVTASADTGFVAAPAPVSLAVVGTNGKPVSAWLYYDPDGSILLQSKKVGAIGAEIITRYYYQPVNPAIGATVWIRSTGDIATSWTPLSSRQTWSVSAVFGEGVVAADFVVQVANDPDGTNVLSTMSAHLEAETS